MDVSLKSSELKWQRRVYRKEINFEGDVSGTTALWGCRSGRKRKRTDDADTQSARSLAEEEQSKISTHGRGERDV
jgi:hypothetical protein